MAEATGNSLLNTVNSLPLSRKISLIVVTLLSLSIFVIMIMQARVADYRLLFANLSETDASSVMTWLKDRKIPYQLKDGGKAIQIPADKVYETRLELAGAGMPRGGSVGFEIFDKQNFGMTDFAQKVNYQRALQGELSRTIVSLSPVEGARVLLAIPEKRLFREQQKEATASIIVKLAAGRNLRENQIQGIIHLVAGSIEGLEVENIAIVDSNGRVLSKAVGDNSSGQMTAGMLDYQQTIEQRLEKRAQSLLDRALGASNSLAQVTAQIDFSQVEKTEERFDPNGSVPRSEQVTEEKSDDGGFGGGGIPGVQSNLNGNNVAQSTGGTTSSRSSETINYEISKIVNRVIAPVGTVKSLSVAVLIADNVVPGAEGKEPTHVPRDKKEIQAIQDMITSALGLDMSRGDQISVVSMPFENSFFDQAISEPTPSDKIYEYMPFIKYGLLGLAGILLYILMVKPIIRSMQGGSTGSGYQTVQELEAELHASEQLLAPKDPTLLLRDQILRSETPPTQVIKSWLNNE